MDVALERVRTKNGEDPILNEKSPFRGVPSLFEAERCYRLAGDTEKSVQVLRQAKEMKRSFERR